MTGAGRGTVYVCPVCGAEIGVLARRHGEFRPRCCNVEMTPRRGRLVFFVCPVCGSEVASLTPNCPGFRPRCCNADMRREAA